MSQSTFRIKRVTNHLRTPDKTCSCLWTSAGWLKAKDSGDLFQRDDEEYGESRVLCKNCALSSIRKYNRMERPQFYTAFDMGEHNSWDAVQQKLEELYDRRYFNNYLRVIPPEPELVRRRYGIHVGVRRQVAEYLDRCGDYPKFRIMIALNYPYDVGGSTKHIDDYLESRGPNWDAYVFPLVEGDDWELQRIFVSLSVPVGLIDATSRRIHDFGPGAYELERVMNPYGHKIPWLVIKGTKIGLAETCWLRRRVGMLEEDENSPRLCEELKRTDLDVHVQYFGNAPLLAVIRDAKLEDQRPGVPKR